MRHLGCSHRLLIRRRAFPPRNQQAERHGKAGHALCANKQGLTILCAANTSKWNQPMSWQVPVPTAYLRSLQNKTFVCNYAA